MIGHLYGGGTMEIGEPGVQHDCWKVPIIQPVASWKMDEMPPELEVKTFARVRFRDQIGCWWCWLEVPRGHDLDAPLDPGRYDL